MNKLRAMIVGTVVVLLGNALTSAEPLAIQLQPTQAEWHLGEPVEVGVVITNRSDKAITLYSTSVVISGITRAVRLLTGTGDR